MYPGKRFENFVVRFFALIAILGPRARSPFQ